MRGQRRRGRFRKKYVHSFKEKAEVTTLSEAERNTDKCPTLKFDDD